MPISPEGYYKWRLTTYYVASQSDHSGVPIVPILDTNNRIISLATSAFFSSLALEGSGKTCDGKLVNVSGGYVTPSNPSLYDPVWQYHQKYMSKRPPSYSGLVLGSNDRVTRVLSFTEVPQDKIGVGYGQANGMDLVPGRTLAADIGRGKKSEPKYKGKGGLVPLTTKVYINCFDGMSMPDGTTHDGWLTVVDTGGGIYGAHFDCFAGMKSSGIKVPNEGGIWFEGIEERVPEDYTYGLSDG